MASGSRLSWSERVRVSMTEEIVGAVVEGLMIRDLREARAERERGSLVESVGRLRGWSHVRNTWSSIAEVKLGSASRVYTPVFQRKNHGSGRLKRIVS